jgi:hypothetical protein
VNRHPLQLLLRKKKRKQIKQISHRPTLDHNKVDQHHNSSDHRSLECDWLANNHYLRFKNIFLVLI